MTPQTRKRFILIGVAVLVVAAVVFALLPERVPVQTALVRRDSLRVIVEEEGETEVTDRYVIASPVTAFVRRIELEAGDVVAAGQPVAQLEPPRTTILDPRTRSEATERVNAARAAVVRAEAAAQHARVERERTERLAAGGSATPQALERAVSEARQAEGNLEVARAELGAAQAALRGMDGDARLAVQQVLHAPVAGRVLAVRRRSEGQVHPGDTLVVLGDTEQLEVRADVLSEDAVRIAPGTRVLIEQWGGEATLEAAVRRVEPQAFTSVSSLGVEEQRVTVIADFVSPPSQWAASLGSGFRVLARFVVWEGQNVLQVPTSALFRTADGWATYIVTGGRAERRSVTTGQSAGLATQILSGLEQGEEVIVHPGNRVEAGVRVQIER
jgi:HlyD family secretion protein